jgi:glycosyltransferase involved in cell wall biosynthesis
MTLPNKTDQTPDQGPLVSVGCAVYNGERTLARALRSIVEQSYSNLEIIVADDSSTDRSVEIAATFAKSDPRVRIIRNPSNIGLIHNFNALFREARGKYFMWADQDDFRDRTFITKTLARLEADSDAVLCHSWTGGFVGRPEDLKAIGSLGGVADASSLLRRYTRLLREFADTTIYGLIRSEAMRRTGLWPADVGSANNLLFELALRGKFLEVPETLYFYSGRGPTNRPTPAEEYARQNAGKRMPRFYMPFVVVSYNQITGIWRAPAGLASKIALTTLVCANTSLVVFAKLVYRVIHFMTAGRVPPVILRACQAALGSTAHIRFVNNANMDESLYPKDWALRPFR